MFDSYVVVAGEVIFVASYKTGEEAVSDLLKHWHEDAETHLAYVKKEDAVYATLSCGKNRDQVTVCRTNGAAQWYNVKYILDENEKYVRTEIKSLTKPV